MHFGRDTIFRPWRAVAASLGAFLLAAAALHALLPDPIELPAPYRGRKLALIETWRGEANLAAFGSSRMHEGFLPSAFDGAMKEGGFGVFSLNLGVVAGSLSEQRVLARRFLRRAMPRRADCPLLALIEINAGLNLPPETRFSPRTVNLYDADTLSFVAAFEDGGVRPLRRLGRIGFALSASLAHYANAGMLGARIFSQESPAGAEDARGRIGLPVEAEDAAHVAAMFAARPVTPRIEAILPGAGYARLLADIAPPAGTPFHAVYVVAPMLPDMERMQDYPAELQGPGGAVPILNMARPDRFPALYQPAHWRNATHMTPQGAALYSSLLAKELAARLPQGLIPRGCGG